MNKKNKTQFSHMSKATNIEKFYKIMSGKKRIITKKDELEFEASYFAMCLLLPKDSFLQMIEFLGGIDVVKSDYDKINCIARSFNVEYKLVEARINSLISQKEYDNYGKSRNKILKPNKKG